MNEERTSIAMEKKIITIVENSAVVVALSENPVPKN